MILKKEQLQTITQQMANTASAEDLLERDPQLGRLLAQYFTLFVGIDVCLTTFMVVVKNSAFHLLASQQFDNETPGFEQLLAFLKTLNPDNTMQIQAAIECTSVYHLALVRFLKEQEIEVFVYNAQTASHQDTSLSQRKEDRHPGRFHPGQSLNRWEISTLDYATRSAVYRDSQFIQKVEPICRTHRRCQNAVKKRTGSSFCRYAPCVSKPSGFQ
jgi:hypothetical protein